MTELDEWHKQIEENRFIWCQQHGKECKDCEEELCSFNPKHKEVKQNDDKLG